MDKSVSRLPLNKMEDEIVVDEADLTFEDHTPERHVSGEKMETKHEPKSRSNSGELLERLRCFQKRNENLKGRCQRMANSNNGKTRGLAGSVSAEPENSVSLTAHFETNIHRSETADEIISRLEFKIKKSMAEGNVRDLDVVELVRKDACTKYSKEDVKRITKKLVKRIAENAVVGQIVDEAIEDMDSKHTGSGPSHTNERELVSKSSTVVSAGGKVSEFFPPKPKPIKHGQSTALAIPEIEMIKEENTKPKSTSAIRDGKDGVEPREEKGTDEGEVACLKDRPEKIKGAKRRKISSSSSTKKEETTEQILEACGLSRDYIDKVKEADKKREASRSVLFETKKSRAEEAGTSEAPPSRTSTRPLLSRQVEKFNKRMPTTEEPPPPGEDFAALEEDVPEPMSLVDEEEGFLTVSEMEGQEIAKAKQREMEGSAPPGAPIAGPSRARETHRDPPRLLGAAAEIMAASARRRVRLPSPGGPPSPPPRRYAQPPMQLPADFNLGVGDLLAEARLQYDQARFQMEAANNLARAYQMAMSGQHAANLPIRPPGTSGWIFPRGPPPFPREPEMGQLPAQRAPPGHGSDRTRERRRLRVQASRRRAGLPYYVYEDQTLDPEDVLHQD